LGRLVVVVVAAGIAGAFGAGGATAHRSTLVLPKASTPGAFNPDVRQSTIDQTICVHGWTKTIRPPRATRAG